MYDPIKDAQAETEDVIMQDTSPKSNGLSDASLVRHAPPSTTYTSQPWQSSTSVLVAEDEEAASMATDDAFHADHEEENSSDISDVDSDIAYEEDSGKSSRLPSQKSNGNGHGLASPRHASAVGPETQRSDLHGLGPYESSKMHWHPTNVPTSSGVDQNPSSTSRSTHSMSISAMLSNPVEKVMAAPDSLEDASPSLKKGPISKSRIPKQKAKDDSFQARKPKLKTNSELKRKRDSRKPRITPENEGSLSFSSDSDASDEEQYGDLKENFQNEWHRKCSQLVAEEQSEQRRRGNEAMVRLLSSLDKRVRKTQKLFENQHYRTAMVRATFEEGVRREQQRRELALSKKVAQASVAAMAPPSTSKKSNKKRRRETANGPQSQAMALAQSHDSAETAGEEWTSGKGKKSSLSEHIESLQDAIWYDIVKKDIPKVHRIVQTNIVNRAMNLKKTGQLCAKEARRWQFRTNKTSKDMQAKSKRAMREMLVFWKRNERGDMLNRQKAEKEIIDKAKKEEEDRESRRQARKLNFLITQTELYSHFIGDKVKTAEAEQSEDTAGDARLQNSSSRNVLPIDLRPLKPGETAAELDFDADDDDALRAAAARNAQDAVQKAKEKAQGFDTESGARAHSSTDHTQADPDAMNLDFQNPTMIGNSDISQPRMLNATLKEYQLKGLNWLVNLYEQGINGILADEMGLGKTVQSISVMAHLAETYNIWGPFLVIAPASTLHNWQQEITKFVPRLKALPYWGNTKDRKVLRKFWDRKRATYTEDAPFHVVITSYQLVVQDSQYFQNVKWQYMILDEAQAIKSSQSSRWKNLLGFKCRNRLLLTGTPIQNTMQELWALLHFIMPSLFDSHNEFSEWFSKDIESHAQKNSELNEEQLKRLHMILKPFMLRRVKKNVQKELGDKIELDVFCDLNMRQRGLYTFLRREISMKDILEKATSDRDADLSSLMNLVMQLRKVCNHPDLFERADVQAPLVFADMPKTANIAKEGRLLELSYAATSAVKFQLPKIIYRDGGLLEVPSEESSAGSRKHCLYNLMNIFSPKNVTDRSTSGEGVFSCSRLAGLSAGEVSLMTKDPLRSATMNCTNLSLLDSGKTACVRKMLQIRKAGHKSGTSSDSISPMAALLAIHSSAAEKNGYHRVDPVYDPRVLAPPVDIICSDRTFMMGRAQLAHGENMRRILYGLSLPEENAVVTQNLYPDQSIRPHGLLPVVGQTKRGYNSIRMPSMQTFITDSGKLAKLDELLHELKKNDHRVLLYFQMTKMIDLMEEYLVYRQYKYLRLDGSSKISDRRDMVNDWQTRPELFVFLLSTRAGGLGINLTAADTVIFYDSDWNPTIDSQAMDRAHRLGQTKQVTVYRLITRGSIEERILSRAKEKEEVQKVVISGGDYKQGTTDNIQFQAQKGGGRDVVSWLLEDDDQVKKVSQHMDSMPSRSRKATKARSGPTLDDMYHEGENRMEVEGHASEGDAEIDQDGPAKKKKKSGGGASSKKKSKVPEL